MCLEASQDSIVNQDNHCDRCLGEDISADQLPSVFRASCSADKCESLGGLTLSHSEYPGEIQASQDSIVNQDNHCDRCLSEDISADQLPSAFRASGSADRCESLGSLTLSHGEYPGKIQALQDSIVNQDNHCDRCLGEDISADQLPLAFRASCSADRCESLGGLTLSHGEYPGKIQALQDSIVNQDNHCDRRLGEDISADQLPSAFRASCSADRCEYLGSLTLSHGEYPGEIQALQDSIVNQDNHCDRRLSEDISADQLPSAFRASCSADRCESLGSLTLSHGEYPGKIQALQDSIVNQDNHCDRHLGEDILADQLPSACRASGSADRCESLGGLTLSHGEYPSKIQALQDSIVNQHYHFDRCLGEDVSADQLPSGFRASWQTNYHRCLGHLVAPTNV